MSWTDERVELLRRLWLEGLSASRIAAELSNGITRNAVIGKVHRLGLSGRVKAPIAAGMRSRIKPPQKPMMPMKPQQPAIRGNTALALKPEMEVEPQRRPAEDVVIPMSERVTIMELRESMCRWPLGDPTTTEFRYCGGKAPIGGGPYCAQHTRIAYQPLQDRRRERERERRLLRSA